MAFYGAFDALLRRVNDQDGGRPLFQQCLAVGEFFNFGQHPGRARIHLMAIRFADTKNRPQIYQGRIVAEVIEGQQQAVFRGQFGVFPASPCQRAEGFLFADVNAQLAVEVLEIFL